VLTVCGTGVAICVVDHGKEKNFGAVLVDPHGRIFRARTAAEIGRHLGYVLRKENWRIVLAFEAPTAVSVGECSAERPYESVSQRPLWIGSGQDVFTLALAQIPYICQTAHEVAGYAPRCTATPSLWGNGGVRVLLIEAFVSAGHKTAVAPKQRGVTVASIHDWEALCAAVAIYRVLLANNGQLVSSVCEIDDPHGSVPVLNQAVASALYAGWIVDHSELHQPPVVIGPEKCDARAAARLLKATDGEEECGEPLAARGAGVSRYVRHPGQRPANALIRERAR
jgi:hypothetical protein